MNNNWQKPDMPGLRLLLKCEGTRRSSALDKLIGKQIKQFRDDRAMTQQDLAHIIGVTYQQIQKYEAGTSRITASKLLMCSVKTGQSLDYFLKGARDHLQQACDANNQ